jgi:hypothetical protein
MTHDGEAQPAVLAEHAFALRTLEIGETMAFPEPHVVDRERGRDLWQRRLRERLGRYSRHVREQPEDRSATRLGHRHEQHAGVRQHDRPLQDVIRERGRGLD